MSITHKILFIFIVCFTLSLISIIISCIGYNIENRICPYDSVPINKLEKCYYNNGTTINAIIDNEKENLKNNLEISSNIIIFIDIILILLFMLGGLFIMLLCSNNIITEENNNNDNDSVTIV